MNGSISSYEDVTLWQIGRAVFPDVERFVSNENYKITKAKNVSFFELEIKNWWLQCFECDNIVGYYDT